MGVEEEGKSGEGYDMYSRVVGKYVELALIS